ncbi:hypothetical protein C0995_004730 [Termitomyces sp. Mi166|nr:hypothetical protein C0995_004730 [Termitomyces sp. Mi166\
MTPVNFKLTEPNGLTRRVAFLEKPAWNSLAAKIELLYGIPIEKVSVSYIDTDNDQVTLSSQEELDDFFATSATDGQVIKFVVQDLSTVRRQRTFPQSPRNPSRNTFGIATFDIEDDWQTLPMPPISEIQGLFMPNSSNEGHTHAFVESLESDTGTVKNKGNAQHKSVISSPVSSPYSPCVVPLDKGKEKAAPDDDVSSTGSVIGEDAPPKPPIHVYNCQTSIHPVLSSGSPYVPAQSTPKADPQTLNTGSVQVKEDTTSDKDDPTDHHLTTFDGQNSHASTSFFNDLTSFLTTFSNVVAAHPELSEGIRNILRNTSNGTYWHAHRDAMSQAAQNIAHESGMAAEALRETEEAARRRLADALGGIFRTLSETLQPAHNDVPLASNPTETTQPADEGQQEEPGPATEPQGPSRVSPDPFRPSVSEFPPGPSFWMHREPGRWGHRGTPLPQPPPFIPLPNLYGSHLPPPPPMPGSWHRWAPPPPPPTIPGHFPPGPPPPRASPRSPPPGPYFTPSELSPLMGPSGSQASKPTPQELRAQVDEAKARYRAEKEKYRLDREERRKERETRAQAAAAELTKSAAPVPPVRPARPTTPPAIAVQGRSGQPTREIFSVHRHHTHLGHGSSSRLHYGHGREHSDLRTRTVNRIAKRLADMGFSEGTHPDLPNKIRAQLPIDGIVRNDSEDDIVTTLLEDLLAVSPKPPVASGSGTRGFSGAWH